MNPSRLEVLTALPAAPARPLAVLFVHGAFTGAWCWREHFLAHFAAAGWPSHALSLSGHGASAGRERLDQLSIADYCADVRAVLATLDKPAVLIGHSMGGFIVQKLLEEEEERVRAAVLMASVPPQGLMAASVGLWLARPDLLSDLNRLMCGSTPAVDRLAKALFAQPVDAARLARYWHWAQPESHRALWDMTLDPPQPSRVLAHRARAHLKVVGGERDLLIPATLTQMTARSYGVTATIYSGLGHGLMLERDWPRVADDLLAFLETLR